MDAMRIEGFSPAAAAIAAASHHEEKHEVREVQKTEATQPQKKPSPSKDVNPVKEAEVEIQQEDSSLQKGIRFSVNLSEDRLQVQIVDQKRNEIIRSIPSEEMLKVMDKINEFIGAKLDLNC